MRGKMRSDKCVCVSLRQVLHRRSRGEARRSGFRGLGRLRSLIFSSFLAENPIKKSYVFCIICRQKPFKQSEVFYRMFPSKSLQTILAFLSGFRSKASRKLAKAPCPTSKKQALTSEKVCAVLAGRVDRGEALLVSVSQSWPPRRREAIRSFDFGRRGVAKRSNTEQLEFRIVNRKPFKTSKVFYAMFHQKPFNKSKVFYRIFRQKAFNIPRFLYDFPSNPSTNKFPVVFLRHHHHYYD